MQTQIMLGVSIPAGRRKLQKHLAIFSPPFHDNADTLGENMMEQENANHKTIDNPLKPWNSILPCPRLEYGAPQIRVECSRGVRPICLSTLGGRLGTDAGLLCKV